MKNIIALLGFLGVASVISGCSSDSPSSANESIEASDESSSSIEETSSSSKADTSKDEAKSSSASKTSSSSSAASVTDTISTHVYVSSDDKAETPYMSSGVFCWSDECKAQGSSASTATSSSSAAEIVIGMSSVAQILPLVTETQMIDQRDQQSYSLQTIAGLHWMSENLNYAIESGSFCISPTDSTDECAKYGRFYTATAAKKACPSGWRLPTSEEIQAADAAVDEDWWTLGGRFKYTDDTATAYGLDGEQGYWWISTGASWRVQPSSDEHVEQTIDGGDGRAYSVRCVEDSSN